MTIAIIALTVGVEASLLAVWLCRHHDHQQYPRTRRTGGYRL